MENVNPEQWKDFVIVLVAICGLIVLAGNVWKTFKTWRQPSADLTAWRTEVDRKLANDNNRLKVIEDGNKVITRGILALISHEINGNSDDKLKASQQEITNYLIDR